MKVLALDAALTAVGYAVIRDGVVTVHGAASFTRHKPEDRRECVMDFARALLNEHQPDDGQTAFLALEKTWVGKNISTADKLAELRGCLIEAGRNWDFDVRCVTPAEWMASAGIPTRVKRTMVKRRSREIAAIRARADFKLMSEDAADAINLGWHVAGVERIKASRKVG